MSRNRNDWSEDVADLAKSAGKAVFFGFGRILGIGVVSALFGGVGGGILGAVYGFPIVAGIIGGAVLAVVAVFAIFLLAAMDW